MEEKRTAIVLPFKNASVELLGNNYPVRPHERLTWGGAWCGPELLEHGQATKIAAATKAEGSDGFDVEVWVTALPARFYRVVARPTKNSIGVIKAGWVLPFGTINEQWLRQFVEMITRGLIGQPIEWQPGAEDREEGLWGRAVMLLAECIGDVSPERQAKIGQLLTDAGR